MKLLKVPECPNELLCVNLGSEMSFSCNSCASEDLALYSKLPSGAGEMVQGIRPLLCIPPTPVKVSDTLWSHTCCQG